MSGTRNYRVGSRSIIPRVTRYYNIYLLVQGIYNRISRMSSGGMLEDSSMQEPIVFDTPRNDDNEINLTPMLDVVFIMLIFFIVTASFIKEVGIDVSPPNSLPKTILSDQSIMITIVENSGIWMSNRLIDPRAVRANIERMRAENPDASVVIQPDKYSTNDTLVQVMNASREAGVYDIAIVPDSDIGVVR